MNTYVVGFLTLFYLATWAVILWGIYSVSQFRSQRGASIHVNGV